MRRSSGSVALFAVVASALCLACTGRPPVDLAASSGRPPAPVVEPAPAPAPAPVASAAPAEPAFGERRGRVCEPVVRCGFWSGCVWLERIDATRHRALSGPERGGVFVRRHDCASVGGGTEACAVYCTGADGGPPCVDGLHPEQEACAESAPPRPIAIPCLVGAGVCGSLM